MGACTSSGLSRTGLSLGGFVVGVKYLEVVGFLVLSRWVSPRTGCQLAIHNGAFDWSLVWLSITLT